MVTERPAYNSVLTVLRILERKGYVRHEKEGRAFVYSAVVDRQQARRGALSQLLSRFFNGSREQLVMDLLGHEDVDGEELQKVKALLERQAAGSREKGSIVNLLIEWLFEGLALAAVATVAVALVPASSAAPRHLVWWLALLGVLALPWAPNLFILATAGSTATLVGSGLVANGSPLEIPAPPHGCWFSRSQRGRSPRWCRSCASASTWSRFAGSPTARRLWIRCAPRGSFSSWPRGSPRGMRGLRLRRHSRCLCD